MSTFTQIIYQVVFCTKNREPVLHKENRNKLYAYISGVLINEKCHTYQINGIEDHIHIVFHLHPSIALASLIKDIKIASSLFIKQQNLFINFTHWQEGYAAFTYNIKELENLVNYVKNQESHHKNENLLAEFKDLLFENEVDFEEKYL